MNEIFYQARAADGSNRQGSLIASDVADARFQLTRMGLRDIRILSGMTVPMQIEHSDDAQIAALAVQTQFDSLPRAVLRIFTGNWLLWLPLSAFAAWSLYEGSPFGMGDYIAFTLFALGVAAALFLALPTVLYQQILWARVFARYRRGLLYHAIFRRVNLLGGLPDIAVGIERCKLLAGMGKTEQARREFAVLAADATDTDRLVHGAALADAMQDRDGMIQLQRELIAAQPDNPEPKVDLAMSLARFSDRIDEAEQLIAGIHPNGLPEIFSAGLAYTRGLIAQARQDHATAARELKKSAAIFQVHPLPLAFAIGCEIRGYLAISLKALGKHAEAEALWRAVWPVLAHHGCDAMQQRYTAAGGAKREL